MYYAKYNNPTTLTESVVRQILEDIPGDSKHTVISPKEELRRKQILLYHQYMARECHI
jgi:hypothetical protein